MTRARTLRPHQAGAVAAVDREWEAGRSATAVVHATGLGKTDVGAHVALRAAARGEQVLWLAHRVDLLDQASDRMIIDHGYDRPLGRMAGGIKRPGYPIITAMTPTMARPENRRRITNPIDLVVYDEVHHAAAPTNRDTLEWAGVFGVNARARLLGLTATLTRADKYGLGWMSLADEKDTGWGVRNEFLVEPRGKVVVAPHMDLTKAKVSRGDYQDNDLGEMVAQDTAEIVKAWQRYASDRITIAFTPTVAAASALAAEFAGVGVSVAVVTGKTKQGDRERIYEQLGRGEIRVMVGVMVHTEGWDCPPVSCVLMARPTKLAHLYQQMVGRGLRLLDPEEYPGHPPKLDCLILDVVGSSRGQALHSLVDLLPDAPYDTTALDRLPCERCGGVGRACVCPKELGERDPDGGRIKLIGPADYEDLDLLLTVSDFLWLALPDGTPILPAGDRFGILYEIPGTGLFLAGHLGNRGSTSLAARRADGVWLEGGKRMPLDEARQCVERWVASYPKAEYSVRDAKWRAGKPTLGQINIAYQQGIPHPEWMNRGRLSDEISIIFAARRLRKR